MAYAAVTSLMRTIHQSMELTGCDLQPFYEKLKSLRVILEKSCNIMGDHEGLTILEVEIVEVAYTTEDMVDSESRNVFLAQNLEERSRAMWEIFFVLEQALECIDSTVKQWMATSDSMKDLKPQTSSLVSLPEHAVEQPENIMVGRENEFEMMLDQLARGGRELEVGSIVATVSQEYCVRNVLLGLLSLTSDEPDDQLADRLQKHLKGRRYLVVIDDIWTTEAWDDIKLCFPDCINGSRILLTTRNVEVAEYASSVKSFHPFILPSEILTMPQLRKLCMGWNYLRSHEPTENRLVLKSLQCLHQLNPWYCTGSFFRLFPNLKKLKVFGVPQDFRNRKDLYDFRYLYQLEPLRFQKEIRRETHLGGTAPTLLLPPPDAFPQNLKSLTFRGDFLLAWKDLSIVGKLPKLEVLKLSHNAVIGEEWEVVEEGFPHLKFLFLDTVGIRYWRASSDHFPYLERLFLRECEYLDSIPRDFADITTLALIDIQYCQQSVGNSAKQIQQDIQDNYGSSIEVHTRDL
ncbi:hypothetical protein MTR67_053679 [Solanum verrucosum]|uniref:NB-ARC domain-containing protein n=1 Tax=Solanum verrucosum TaxID=315347 RepID=A0AAF0V9Z6_SOLVR|nr:hypothetical protein MTR67_053679 [Solanum verrucosum]